MNYVLIFIMFSINFHSVNYMNKKHSLLIHKTVSTQVNEYQHKLLFLNLISFCIPSSVYIGSHVCFLFSLNYENRHWFCLL